MIRTRPCTSATAPARKSDTVSSLSITQQIEEALEHDRGRDTTLLSSHRQDWTPGKPTQHTIVLDAPQKEVELNSDGIPNTNAYSGVSDTLPLDNDVKNSKGNTPPEATAKCRQCEDVLDTSTLRDYPFDCSYVNKNNTEQEWISAVVRKFLRSLRDNNRDQLPLDYFVKTYTKTANRLVLGLLNSLCFEHQRVPMLLSTVERAIFNDSQMKDLGWHNHLPDEDCETWMSITARTRHLSRISKRSWMPARLNTVQRAITDHARAPKACCTGSMLI
ncbi:hypothetical protein Y032_0694g1595 [Ancylostoma ceylanicum]|uniref:Uncharacterized protein n=1 Tax=Ancylostoma ceylanicum TaxID=53326 RepID=A0A016WGQ8_9BILA|nr:hypothetical protein Y032_0694g1595 [Ancylostoma ceylanicum]